MPQPLSRPNDALDHRSRVGAIRRERTRLVLMQSALTVLGNKDPDAATIEDFIAAAKVSRGTFYNYFATTSDLLFAVATTMSDEVLSLVDPVVLQATDPVVRFATGTRLYMHTALRYPLWGRFITRVGTRIATRGQLIERYLTRDLDEALRMGTIRVDSLLVARDIILGSIFYGIETMLTEPTQQHHPEHLIRHVLIAFGVSPSDAHAIAYRDLEWPGNVTGPMFASLSTSSAKKRAPRRNKATNAAIG